MCIPLSECKNGFIYRIHSRNLSIGVFNAKDNGFIGIRTKFGDQYLFTEYHWDTGTPYGTVKPKEIVGELPEDIEAKTDLGTTKGNRPVFFDNTPDENGQGRQVVSGGEIKVRGWCYESTSNPVKQVKNIFRKSNKKLFDYLVLLKSSMPKVGIEEDEDF
jgi:hypothetical protein